MRTPQETEALERIDKDLREMENTFQSDIGSEQPNHHIHSPYAMTTCIYWDEEVENHKSNK